MPDVTRILLPTFVALCLGALVGLERQVAQEESEGAKDFPGVRTMAFMALLGALAVLVSDDFGPWLGIALFLVGATFLVLRYWYDASTRGDPGYTTEIAALCTFAVGVLAQSGKLTLATAITIVMVALLRSKRALHRAGELLSPEDMEVGIRFLAIALVVWPLLPDAGLPGPFEVLRPRDVWRMVVLISGLSFAGYVLMRLRLHAQSHLLTGFLGGLVSSTATALAYARIGRSSERQRLFEGLIVIASVTAFLRIVIEVAVVAPALLPHIVVPIGAMALVGLVAAGLLNRPAEGDEPQHAYANPLTLRVALMFAALYAAVLFTTDAVREQLAGSGLYVATALAALAGADAPTLSLARLAADAAVPEAVAARGVTVAAIFTTLGKAALVAAIGQRAFGLPVVATLACMAATGAAALWALAPS